MAIAFRASSGADLAAAGPTITITKPAGTASTDVLVVSFAWDNGVATTLTPPTGWTAIANPVTSGTMRTAAFWALGSVSALGFTNTHAQNTGWVCAAFSGVDNSTPIDATGTTSTSSNSQTITSNAVTAVTANAMNVSAIGPWNGPSSLAATGWTVVPNATSITSQEADICYKAITATDSTGTTVFTAGGQVASGQLLAAIPFVLRPAGGAPAFVAEPYLPVAGRQAVHRAAHY